MAISIENALSRYQRMECPSITSAGMLFSRFGIEMTLSEKILAKQIVRVSQVWTDSSGDLQIDGLCILIDGELVTDADEATNSIMLKGGIENISRVELFFIQSKNKKSFSVSEFNHFSSGVQNFVTNKSVPAGVNAKVENWYKVWKVIQNSISHTNAQVNVIANMFIVFNGNKLNNALLIDQMRNFQQNLPNCSLVTQVKYKAIGSAELVEIYKRRNGADQSRRFHTQRPAFRNQFTHSEHEEGNLLEEENAFNDGFSGSQNPLSVPHKKVVVVRKRPAAQVGRSTFGTVPHRQSGFQHGPVVSINAVKAAIRNCNQDPNGYVFLADLGAVVSVNGSLKYYLAKFPQHFQFDNNRLPLKVKIVGEGYHQNSVERPQFHTNPNVAARNELKKIISGRVISVDTNDWSGIIEASGYGSVPFYFSDLVNPEQESDLTPGSFVRFEVTNWCNMTKVKSNTLLVI